MHQSVHAVSGHTLYQFQPYSCNNRFSIFYQMYVHILLKQYHLILHKTGKILF